VSGESTFLNSSSHSREGYLAINEMPYLKSRDQQVLAATLDNLAMGVIVVTDGNQILYANRAGVQMFARGLPVHAVGGRLSTRDTTAIDQLARAIALALHGGSGTGATGIGVPLRNVHGEPAIAHVLPLAYGGPQARIPPRATAAVFIVSAAGRPIVDLTAVAECLGLTASEARLVEKLAGGSTLVDAAHALGIAETTAKTHLTHIFSKAGVSRQTELIALIHRLVPPVRSAAA
jgi:DNA-binding CsgD family transcriptional regulator